MSKLNHELLELVKKGFVPMPGGQTEPVAGASPMTAGLAQPMMDPAMAGGDPAAGGMPMDPAMMGGDPAAGGMPMDPAMAGGAPGGEMPVDPAMLEALMGAAGGQAPDQSGTITLTVDQLIQLFQAFSGGGTPKKPKEPGTGGNGMETKLDTIIGLLGGQAQPQMAPQQ